MKTRRDFLKLIGLSAPALGLLSCSSIEEASGKKPNVIFILTDDQGYGDLHCNGNPFIKTPQMDKIASESASFTNFHVMTCCAPSRAMLMTGRYPMRAGVWCTVGNTARMRRGEVTMADVFMKNGYRTGFFGKWHLGDNYPFRPQDRGFEEVLMSGAGGVGNTPDYWANDYFDDTYMRNGKWEKNEGFCTDVWFAQALKFIQTNKDRPFFCYISTNAPHLPFVAPKKYLDMYGKEENESLRAFYAMITNLDDNIDSCEKLVELDIERDTILVFITDNGSVIGWRKYNAGMRGNKGVQWDGGHRVPFFIRWPNGGLKAGQIINQITSGIDLLPTLMDLCGLERQEGPPLDGSSLVPLLKNNTAGWPNRTLFVQQQWGNPQPQKWDRTAVMTDEWRLVDNKILNQIKKDPGQQQNMIKDHPQVTAKLRAEYDKWWAEIGKADPDQGKEITIGSDKENPCKLTGHDIDHLWNHDQVLEGIPSVGYWNVIVAHDGEYEFELRRYPVEANAPIRGTIPVPEEPMDFPYNQKNQYAMTHKRSHGLPVVSATCKIGTFQQKIDLPRKTTSAVDYTLNENREVLAVKFRTKLNAGKTKLEAWFADKNDKHVTNAYYIYVKRLSI